MHTDARMEGNSDRTPNGQDKRATRITVTLPPEDYELLVRVARTKRVSASWVVRDAVGKYLAADMPLFSQSPN